MDKHASDCATHNEPALPAGECDCATPMEGNLRWTALLYYRTTIGLSLTKVTFEEIADLDAIVERGPDWHALDRIEIRLSHNDEPTLTVEQANAR